MPTLFGVFGIGRQDDVRRPGLQTLRVAVTVMNATSWVHRGRVRGPLRGKGWVQIVAAGHSERLSDRQRRVVGILRRQGRGQKEQRDGDNPRQWRTNRALLECGAHSLILLCGIFSVKSLSLWGRGRGRAGVGVAAWLKASGLASAESLNTKVGAATDEAAAWDGA